MIPIKDPFLYSVTVSFDSIFKAIKFLLCPVCKQNTILLELCQSDDDFDACNDIITLKCHTCNAPVSTFQCSFKKVIDDKIQMHNIPDEVTIKEEPQDYPDYDAVDIPVPLSPSCDHEPADSDLGLIIGSVTSGSTNQDANFDYGIEPETTKVESSTPPLPPPPPVTQMNGIHTSSQLKLIKSDKDNVTAVKFVIHDLVDADDSIEDFDPRISFNFKKEESHNDLKDEPNNEVSEASKIFTSITLMKRKRYLCPNCKYKTLTKSHFISHKKICKDPELFCPDCDYTTFDKFLLHHHITREHIRQFHCVYCPLKADKQCHIDEHIIQHHGTIPTYTCSQCNFSCLNEEDMNSHTIDHELETPYPCRVCPRAYSSQSLLDKHYRKFHASLLKRKTFVNGHSDPKKSPQKSKKRRNGHLSANFDKYFCSQCNYVANKKCNLTRHVNNIHSDVYLYDS